jgi:hypothetical protein
LDEDSNAYIPVTYGRCQHIAGPFYHGTKAAALGPGDELVPGYGSNFQDRRVSNNIYFTALIETAVWGAELATALAGSGQPGRIYVVEPLGPYEDDPNVTNKKFAGNLTSHKRILFRRMTFTVMSAVVGHAYSPSTSGSPVP